MAQQTGSIAPMQRLAALGLLLFLLAPLLDFVRHQQALSSIREGILFEFTPEGHLLRSFDGEGHLKHPVALAFAPPTAKRRGFTPGALFVVDETTCPDAFNTDSLLELTFDGQCVRAFTGGRHLSARLTGSTGLVFMPDGRLLVASANGTDALLEFTQGGSIVRRFAHLVPFGGLTVDRRGDIYVAGGWSRDSPVHVFSPRGNLLRTVGAAEGGVYQGVAVDEAGSLYVGNIRDHVIEVYDAGGRRVESIRDDALTNFTDRIALRPGGPLYVLDGDHRAVRAFDPIRGILLFSFPAPPGAHLTALTFGPNGNLYAAGYLEA